MYIFSDIDGTMLDHKYGGIRNSTKEALKTLKENGHYLFVSTGRNFTTANYDFGIEMDGFILSSGSRIIYKNEVIYDNPFPSDLVAEIIKLGKEYNIEINLECAVYCYADKYVMNFLEEFDDTTRAYWKPISEYQNEAVYKILIKGYDKDNFLAFKNKLNSKVQFFDNSFNSNLYDEVQLKENDKGRAIEILANNGLIDLKDTIAIGDGDNDVSMFNVVETSIAMGNAKDKLKAVATYVTSDISEDGYYEMFKKLGYLRKE